MEYALNAANGTTIPTYGRNSRSLNLGLRRDFTWRFVVGDMQLSIIGMGLMSHKGIVNCRKNRLLTGVTSLFKPGRIAPSVPSVKVIEGGESPESLPEPS